MDEMQARVRTNFDSQGLMKTLGARLAQVLDGEVGIAMPFSAALSQQHGYAHAGSITSIVDSACGYAALTRAPAGCDVVTIEFKVNFMRPAIGQRFLAVGRVASAGKTMGVCTGEVRAFTGDGDEYKVVALMQATMAFVKA